MIRRILIGDTERVLLFRKRRFMEILEPGEYWLYGTGVEVIPADVNQVEFTSEWANYLVASRPDVAGRYFTIVETGDADVAVVYFDGKVARVIGPGRRALFWKGPIAVTFERINAREAPEVPERLVAPLARLGSRDALAYFTAIDEGKRGLVYLDGKLARELGPGTYAFWSAVSAPRIEVAEMRRQALEIAGQEILTRDKVSIRVNITAVYEIVNLALARARVKDVNETLYRALQIAIRQTLANGLWRRCLRRRPTSMRRWRAKCAPKWRATVCVWA